MNVAILGAGRMGTALARLFVEAGHQVRLANSRGPDSLRALVAELGDASHGRLLTVAEARELLAEAGVAVGG